MAHQGCKTEVVRIPSGEGNLTRGMSVIDSQGIDMIREYAASIKALADVNPDHPLVQFHHTFAERFGEGDSGEG